VTSYQDALVFVCVKVRTDSSTEFGSNPIFVDRIRIESAAGSNPILIVQICTGLDRSVDFNVRVTAFTTGTACTPSIDIKGRIRPMCWTSKIGSIAACWNIGVGKSPMLIRFKDITTGGGSALRRPQDDSGERPPMESYILGPHRSRRLALSWAAGSPRGRG